MSRSEPWVKRLNRLKWIQSWSFFPMIFPKTCDSESCISESSCQFESLLLLEWNSFQLYQKKGNSLLSKDLSPLFWYMYLFSFSYNAIQHMKWLHVEISGLLFIIWCMEKIVGPSPTSPSNLERILSLSHGKLLKCLIFA